MLRVRDLHARVAGKQILNGISLAVSPGEVHAIMGPNGSGKSSFVGVLIGNPAFSVTSGSVEFNGKNLFALGTAERAARGLFVGFQYPMEVPGVPTKFFLKTAHDSQREMRGEKILTDDEFDTLLNEKAELLGMKHEHIYDRAVNEGFSGGEKKRNEILQMAVLEPSVIVLDEIDSGLDVDALRIVAQNVEALRSPDRSIILITHYQRLLSYIVPTHVHVLSSGRIVKSGGKELALELEKDGYEGIV